MGFPYIQPFSKEIVEKLKKREKNEDRVKSSFKYPFVILSSTAIVSNAVTISQGKAGPNEIKNLFDKQISKTTYHGCRIKNEIKPENLYPTGETALGWDFNGKRIVVEGEKNRRVSPPIIQSLEVSTDGANNTLKTANLKIKVFTLKQLEMFELFFLRPSMHLLVEFGTTEISNELLEKVLISNNNYDNFISEYIKSFSSKTNSRVAYAKKIQETNGSFDYIAGIVTNFSFKVNEDLSYDVDLEVSTSNTMLMWLPPTSNKGTGNTPQQNEELKKFSNWVKKIQADLDIILPGQLTDENVWKNDFFNWAPIIEKQKETKVSKNAYLSLRYILNIVNETIALTDDTAKVQMDLFFTSDDKELIPCNTLDGPIISYSSDLIIPGVMPQITTSEKKDKIVMKTDPKDKTKLITLKNEINGYSFNLNSKLGYKDKEKNIIESTKDVQYGNLLNIFINYNSFATIWRRSISRLDVFKQVLELINENMYGLSKLVLAKSEDGNDTLLTIVDKTLKQSQQPEDVLKNLYRFKIGVKDSIVRGFEFNFQLDDLQMGQAAFSSISMIDKLVNPTPDKTGKKEPTLTLANGSTSEYVFTNEGYDKMDMSAYANYDNFISLDKGAEQITLLHAKENAEKKTLLAGTSYTAQETKPKEPAEATEEAKDLTENLNNKSIKFKIEKNPNPITLIYTDKSFIASELKIAQTKSKTTSALTFLEITLVIDGTAGINCGEIFRIDGVPEVYNKNGFFQVTNVKHSVESEGWKTLIEAGYRLNIL